MRGTLLTCLFALGLLMPWMLSAPDGADGGDAKTPAAEEKDPRETFMNLEKGVYADFKSKDFAAAAKKCEAQIALFPKQPGPYYNLACAQALQDKKDDALASLQKSVELGYNDPEHLKTDTDLNALHDDKKFTEIAGKAAENAKANPPAASGQGIDKGAEIPGVKSIEELPEGGLRYRLRLGENATKDKPARVVIWLHPSGGSMNNVVEGQLAADLAKHGFALLVLTQKQWMGWSGPEAEQLLNKTLPAAMKHEGVAQEKPILLGFSAGGQLALQLWETNPNGFAGLVLDAAYPLDMQAYMQGQQKVMKLPGEAGKPMIPIFALVGTADPGSNMWKQVEPKWKQSGLPLTVEYVENGKHQWLVGNGQKKRLLSWLDEVAAGKTPGKLSDQEIADAKKAAEAKAGEGGDKTADKKAGTPPAKPRGQDDGLGLVE